MKEALCPRGHVNRAGARFCSTCGLPLAPVQEKGAPYRSGEEGHIVPAPRPGPAQEPSRAGAPSPAGEPSPVAQPGLAAETGAAVDRSEERGPAVALAATPPSRRRGLWLLLLILLLLLLVAAATYVLWPDGADDVALAEATATVGSGAAEPLATVENTVTPDQDAVLSPTGMAEPEATATQPPTVAPTPTLAPARANLLSNGDFAKEWTAGWQNEAQGEIVGQVIEVVAAPETANGRALHLTRSGPGYLEVWQAVAAVDPALPLLLAGQLRLLEAMDDGVAGLMLVYEGAETEDVLGWSIWSNATIPTLPWGAGRLPAAASSRVSVHELLPGQWQGLDVDLHQEIANRLFTSLTPQEVERVTLVLFSTGREGCAVTGCTAGLWAGDLLLGQELP